MTEVSYFQRFSQRENHVTNNTLLLIRYIYQYSPQKVSALLNSLFEEEISIGLNFQQQVRGTHSVPDGMITQQPLNIFFEAKMDGTLDEEQILRHAKSIKNYNNSNQSAIIIGLSARPLSQQTNNLLKDKLYASGIKFFSVTYAGLVSELQKLCSEYEHNLFNIVKDYHSFLAEINLLSNPYSWMVAFPCGTSWAENIRYGIYYEPASRSSKQSNRFLGIYRHKKITHIGKIISGAVFNGLDFIDNEQFGNWNSEYTNNIYNMVEETEYYNLKEGLNRYYIVDKFEETDFCKTTAYGMFGHRYFDLTQYTENVEYNAQTDTKTVAFALRGKTFN